MHRRSSHTRKLQEELTLVVEHALSDDWLRASEIAKRAGCSSRFAFTALNFMLEDDRVELDFGRRRDGQLVEGGARPLHYWRRPQ